MPEETRSPTVPDGFLARPFFHLRSLPIRFRWEVTRRHPYYQTHWRRALDEHNRVTTDGGNVDRRQPSATAILGLIGVAGEPIDPAKEFADLDLKGIKAGWLSDVIHPISYRGILSLLLCSVPKADLQEVGRLFSLAGEDDAPEGPPKAAFALNELVTLDRPSLNRYPDEPLASINPAATERQVGDSLKALLQAWKEERGLSGQRIRDDDYNELFEVWDLREGWSSGHYDRAADQSYLEIAAKLGRPMATVVGQYRRAFELITGYEFTPARWATFFVALKLHELAPERLAKIRRRQPLQSPVRRPIPEAVLSPSIQGAEQGLIQASLDRSNDADYNELVSDLFDLIASGRSDAELKLRYPKLPRKLFKYLRKRGSSENLFEEQARSD